jgi:hypothetical protein
MQQQQRVSISFQDSNVSVNAKPDALHDSSAVMVLPLGSTVYSQGSFLNCNFTGKNSVALFAPADDQSAKFSCTPCPNPIEIAVTSSTLDMVNTKKIIGKSCIALFNASRTSNQQCPYGLNLCTTIVGVAAGFWTTFRAADGSIVEAVRCPERYCGCADSLNNSDSICQLFPPFSPSFRPDDALCNGNRSGLLCGGCKANYTQSLNGYSCVSNDVCMQNVGWIWMLEIMWYTGYSVYVLFSSVRQKDGLLYSILFYGQMSAFASIPTSSSQSSASLFLSKLTLFGPLLSLYENSCYGPNMGAYAATAAQLSGPALVLVISMLLTLAAGTAKNRFPNFFRRFQTSLVATVTAALLLLFTSVADVVFTLISCQDIGNDIDGGVDRVFIDGTVQCAGAEFIGLYAVAVCLCLVPLVLGAALRWNKIPSNARIVVCSAYTKERYYWGSVLLFFRMIMALSHATVREFPSLGALVMLFWTVAMLILLMLQRPYVHLRTHYMEVFCYASLIVQLALEILVRDSQSLGFQVGSSNKFFSTMQSASDASSVVR